MRHIKAILEYNLNRITTFDLLLEKEQKLFQLNKIFNGKCDIIVEKAFPSSFHSISLDFSISQLHLSTKLSVKLPVCKVCCQNLLLLVTNLKAICLKWPSRSDSQLTSWLAVYASFLSLSASLSLSALFMMLSLSVPAAGSAWLTAASAAGCHLSA